MNWYLVIAIVSAFLLGWAIGIWIGTSKGYAAAEEAYQQLAIREAWSKCFSQFKGGKDEQE
jgi:hypothetical protein